MSCLSSLEAELKVIVIVYVVSNASAFEQTGWMYR